MTALVGFLCSFLTNIFSNVITDALKTPGETHIIKNHEGPFKIDTNIDRSIDRLNRL